MLEKYDVTFQIFDGLKATIDSRIYTSVTDTNATNERQARFGSRKTIYIAGHPWTLTFADAPTFHRNILYT
jgi:hypothetical protein